jgi:cbb3-type cytochrome oxidase subunit 1
MEYHSVISYLVRRIAAMLIGILAARQRVFEGLPQGVAKNACRTLSRLRPVTAYLVVGHRLT